MYLVSILFGIRFALLFLNVAPSSLFSFLYMFNWFLVLLCRCTVFLVYIYIYIYMVPLDGWFKHSLECQVVRGSGAQVSQRIPFPGAWVHGSSLCTTHVVFEVRHRSGHLKATGWMRWQLDAGYTTIGPPGPYPQDAAAIMTTTLRLGRRRQREVDKQGG